MTDPTPADGNTPDDQEAACYSECAALVRGGLAEHGVDANVTSIPPIFESPYEQLGMRCPHGVLWYTEPTTQQQARWIEDGVA